MKLLRQEDIALLLMSEFASLYGGNPVALSYISQKHTISSLYLKKIARLLRQAALIESKEGSGGGYSLSRPPDQITAWDILQAVGQPDASMTRDGAKSEADCPLNAHCLPQTVRRSVSEVLEKGFTSVSLASLSQKNI